MWRLGGVVATAVVPACLNELAYTHGCVFVCACHAAYSCQRSERCFCAKAKAPNLHFDVISLPHQAASVVL